jgi:glycosyltransferase involved in cell wall biosynthesis
MTQPVLSIITPVFNGQHYLRAFLQSVIDQRCTAIEHILIDGHSQDDSVKIIKEFAGKYTHIRWLSESDRDMVDALNKGIAMARGPFIGVLCLNDFYQPNTLNEIVEVLPTLPQPAFLVGNCNMLNENDELLYVNKPEALSPIRIMMGKPFPYNPSAYFYHKSLHQKVGPYNLRDQADVDFLLRALAVAKVHYVDKVWGNFRLLPDSITVKLINSGQLGEQKKKIFEQYIRTLPVVQRIFVRFVLWLNKKGKTIYYFDRIIHYFQNPKDVPRYLRKILRKFWNR